jgi:hypothetical protein
MDDVVVVVDFDGLIVELNIEIFEVGVICKVAAVEFDDIVERLVTDKWVEIVVIKDTGFILLDVANETAVDVVVVDMVDNIDIVDIVVDVVVVDLVVVDVVVVGIVAMVMFFDFLFEYSVHNGATVVEAFVITI